MNYSKAKEEMLDTITKHAMNASNYTNTPVFSVETMQAMQTVNRHEFVPKTYQESSYDDRAMSIGYGQTISQPYIVALMSDILHLNKKSIVLEIGTGCGYHAAILSQLAAEVHTMEVVPELAILAESNLNKSLNVHVHQDNGNLGYPNFAPYQGISVAAAAEAIPEALLKQLAPNGRMIIPIGPTGGSQTLTLIEKLQNNTIIKTPILSVIFVPFIN